MKRRLRPAVLLVIAVLTLAAIPAVFAAGAAYGVEELVWDAAHSTYTYAERPGGLAAMTAALVVCAGLAVFGVATAAAGVSSAVRPRVRRATSEG